MHTRASLERFGAEAMIPAGLAMALVKETGPLTAGLLLSGRIGAGIGAELGAMRVTEQIDALEASAVDAFRYLVVTRVVACVISLPLLTTLMNFAGMIGGFIAETPPPVCRCRCTSIGRFRWWTSMDFIPATMKTMVFGFIIATMSSFLGFTTRSGTEGVGRASTRSVVLSSILIIVSNVVLVRLIFFIFPEAAGMTTDASRPPSVHAGRSRLDHVTKAFGDRKVLDDVSFDVPTGSGFIILGPHRNRQERDAAPHHRPGPARQRPRVRRRSGDHALQRAGARGRGKQIGFLFQNAALFDSISVGENVAFPLRRHTRLPDREIRERAPEKLRRRRPRTRIRPDAGRPVRAA